MKPGTHRKQAPALIAGAILLVLSGCKSTAPSSLRPTSNQPAATTYPPRPTTTPPPFKIVHQDNDTYTLATWETATDDEVSAIIWQLADAAHNHTFDALHLSQSFIDARKPKVWFHLYRGTKCATEKFGKGAYPCGASYHGAGDFTFGSFKDPQYEDGTLRHADNTETALWNPDKPYTSHP